MNRINPLYAGVFLIVIFLFLVFKLSSAKNELSVAKERYKENLTLSTELSGLKKAYAKKNSITSLKSASVVQKKIKNGVILSANSIGVNELNALISKILNDSYNITDLKIKRLSPTKANLHLEITW